MNSDFESDELDEAEHSPKVEPAKQNDLDIHELEKNYRSRLIAANLRTEAVRAGMIDLDGLKLLDSSTVELNSDDTISNGSELMQTLKASKPWLFKSASSSSLSTAPNSRPIRRKTAMEMTDEEYASARSVIVKSQSI